MGRLFERALWTRALWLRTLCLILVAGAASAAPSPEVRFEHVGLDQKQLNDVLQDRFGFLWIAASDGLYRYDGYEFVVHRRGFGDGSIPWTDARALLEDRHGDLWIGTQTGVSRLSRETGELVTFRHDPDDPTSLSNDIVWDIVEDAAGRIWVATTEGLHRLDPTSQPAETKPGAWKSYRHDPNDPASLSHDQVWKIIAAPDGTLWIGTDRGLDLLDPESGRFEHQASLARSPETSTVHTLLLAGGDTALWIGTQEGLFRRENATGKVVAVPELAAEVIRALFLDRQGTIWVGTEHGGLHLLDPATGRVETHRHSATDLLSLVDDRVLAFHEDRSGLVWIGTRRGLDKWNPLKRAMLHYRSDPVAATGLPDNRVRAIQEDRDGVLWIGTVSGLVQLDRETGRSKLFQHDPGDPSSLSYQQVSRLYEDRAGTLWVGTLQGLNRYDPATQGFAHHFHDPDDPQTLASDDVLALYEDRAGRFWVGAWDGGLNLLDRETGRVRRFLHDPDDPSSLPDDIVFAIHEGERGALWLGHWSRGLSRFDPVTERFKSYPVNADDQRSFSSGNIHSIHGDASGILWLGTWGGLDRFDPATEKVRHFTEKDGLVTSSIYGVLEDDQGHLWISTTAGLSSFDPATETFRNFDVTDGLQGNEFSLFAYHRSPSGELFFGGPAGLNAFRPERLATNDYAPPVVLTSVQVLGKEKRETGRGKRVTHRRRGDRPQAWRHSRLPGTRGPRLQRSLEEPLCLPPRRPRRGAGWSSEPGATSP